VGTRENSFVWPVIRFPFRQAGREVSSLISTTAFHRRTELKPKKLKDLYKKSTVQYLPYQRGNIIGSTVHWVRPEDFMLLHAMVADQLNK